MDRAFLHRYEEELGHIRALAAEFGALHPTVARNLSLDTVPCPDPYVERLLEGVAYLAARTRLKLDIESARYARGVLDALYPDLAGPAPAVSMVRLEPGPQVDTMRDGHVVRRGTRLVASLREGLSTRATYTTAQDVALWPVRVEAAEYLQDVGALRAAGLSDRQVGGGEAGLRVALAPAGPGALADLSLDRLDLFLGGRSRGGALFDAVFGHGRRALARPAKSRAAFVPVGAPAMVGVGDDEALLPRVRPSFQGYRLLREYFLMPERFHYLRLDGLGPAVSACAEGALEIVLVLERARPEISDLSAADLALFATPLVNLFERECNIVELDPRRSDHVVHADRAPRARLRDPPPAERRGRRPRGARRADRAPPRGHAARGLGARPRRRAAPAPAGRGRAAARPDAHQLPRRRRVRLGLRTRRLFGHAPPAAEHPGAVLQPRPARARRHADADARRGRPGRRGEAAVGVPPAARGARGAGAAGPRGRGRARRPRLAPGGPALA